MASGSCVPHQQVEHMTAPTRLRTISKKTLATGEPSTHDPKRSFGRRRARSAGAYEADAANFLDDLWRNPNSTNTPRGANALVSYPCAA